MPFDDKPFCVIGTKTRMHAKKLVEVVNDLLFGGLGLSMAETRAGHPHERGRAGQIVFRDIALPLS